MYENDIYNEPGTGTTSNQSTMPTMKLNGEDMNSKQPKKKKSSSVGKKIGMMLLSGLVFGLSAALVFIGVIKASGIDKSLSELSQINEATIEAQEDAKEDSKDAETTEASASDQLNETLPSTYQTATDEELTVAEVAENCMPSVVAITNKSVEEIRSFFGTQQYESMSAGSGIIIGENDNELLIATNNHVVSNANELSVCFEDDEELAFSAKIKGTDSNNDLAIIAISIDDIDKDLLTRIKVATLGSDEKINTGDQVVAIGNALGYGQSVTTGIVSAKNREVTIDGTTLNLIQTDAAINPGNSGGALFNMKGELIGINSSKFASTEVEGMGYAIPIDTAFPILEKLMNTETRDKVEEGGQGYLGISCQNVTSDISEMYGIPRGVYVLEATDGSAAQKAGLRKGDIITSVGERSVSDYDELREVLTYYKAGETVDVTIQRSNSDGSYEEVVVPVELGKNTSNTESSEENNNSNDQRQTPSMPNDNGNGNGRGYSDNGNGNGNGNGSGNGNYYDFNDILNEFFNNGGF